jgi:hypothetical protein
MFRSRQASDEEVDVTRISTVSFQVSILQCKINTISILMHQMRISTNEVSSVVLGPKKLEIQKTNCENCIRTEKTKYCAMTLSQIRRRIELCMREIILRFEMNYNVTTI